jgi:tetratricopeptide (TPR) repeat protein
VAKRTSRGGFPSPPSPTSQSEPSMSIKVEYVGIIAMACLAIGLIVGTSFFGGKGSVNASTFVSMGDAAYDAGAPKAAILAYEKALEIQPHNPDVLTDLGTMYLRTNDLEKAIASFRDAATADPKHIKSRFNLGIALMTSKKYSEAADAFSQCVSIDPKGELAPAAQAHLKIIEKSLKKP